MGTKSGKMKADTVLSERRTKKDLREKALECNLKADAKGSAVRRLPSD
jgi:hypothetical protein